MANAIPLEIYITKPANRFGYFVTLFQRGEHGAKYVGVNMELEEVMPGEVISERAILPVEEKTLVDLGQFLVAQGLINVPVTERERKEHEALKIRYESLERENKMLLEAADTTNRTLERVCETLQLVIPTK